jgi:hypothetical protein
VRPEETKTLISIIGLLDIFKLGRSKKKSHFQQLKKNIVCPMPKASGTTHEKKNTSNISLRVMSGFGCWRKKGNP